jgi:hypothetical protein
VRWRGGRGWAALGKEWSLRRRPPLLLVGRLPARALSPSVRLTHRQRPRTAVFTYLTELHNAKLAAGELLGGPAAQLLEPAGTGAPPGGAPPPEGDDEALAVVQVVGRGAEAPKGELRGGMPLAGAGATAAARGCPATVELQPSRRRGKKTLGQRVHKVARKAGRCMS